MKYKVSIVALLYKEFVQIPEKNINAKIDNSKRRKLNQSKSKKLEMK